MKPALREGDRLLCSRRASLWKDAIVIREIRPGRDIPHYQIKRLVALAGDERGGAVISPGFCWLEGDNKEVSGDSRTFGPVRRSELVAVAIARLRSNRLDDLGPMRGRHRWRFRAFIDDIWQDWRRGVDTRGMTTAASFGFSPVVVRPYEATPWEVIRRALDAVEIGPSDVLLDYGCGKGRVLVEATRYPLRRIIGIDVVPELVAVARNNLRADSRCQVYCSEAATFGVPDDVTIIYMFNSFGESVHHVVGVAVAESIRRSPRRIRVIGYHDRPGWLAKAPTRTLAQDLALWDVDSPDQLGTEEA